MFKRIISMILVLTLSSLLFIGCSKDDSVNYGTAKAESSEESKEQASLSKIQPFAYADASGLKLDKGVYIAVIGKGSKGDYWAAVKKGAEKAVAQINQENGYKDNDKVKVVYSGPENEGDIEQQINIFDEELARYPVAVGISVADYKAYQVQFDLATENDIPLITFDSGSTYPGIMAEVGTNNTKPAQQAADELAKLLNDSGRVLVLSADSKTTADIDRVKGFTDQLQAQHADITIADTVYLDQTEDSAAKILEKYKDVDGIYLTSGTLATTVSDYAAEHKDWQPAIITHDGGTDELKALEDKTVSGLIVQNPFGIGYATVIAAARAALGMGNEAQVDTGYTWITKDNLKQYKDALY